MFEAIDTSAVVDAHVDADVTLIKIRLAQDDPASITHRMLRSK